MESIRIRSCFSQDVTVVSNEFLDRFLPEANGDFLKIYLYLLRSAGQGREALTLSRIADHLNFTEADVSRALRYWEKAGVLALSSYEEEHLTDVRFTSFCTEDAPEERQMGSRPERPSQITSERMLELGEREEVRQSFFVAQQYIGRPLSRGEMQRICYFYDSLRFSADLIDYLIEYCVSRGHKSFQYIEKVALNWKDQGITTIRDARLSEESYHREYYDILKALGMDNHHPIEAEIKIMKKWLEKYNMPMEMIREACTRTVIGASKPTLNYVDSILTSWHTDGAKTLDDVRKLDEAHERSKNAPKEGNGKKKTPGRGGQSFGNFEQRTYDYSSLESKLLEKQQTSAE